VISLRDAPELFLTIAVRRMPAERSEWGEAMLAELAQLQKSVRTVAVRAGLRTRCAVSTPPRSITSDHHEQQCEKYRRSGAH
jgi:hypothetical protein